MEAAGIEPASRSISIRASTYIAGLFSFRIPGLQSAGFQVSYPDIVLVQQKHIAVQRTAVVAVFFGFHKLRDVNLHSAPLFMHFCRGGSRTALSFWGNS